MILPAAAQSKSESPRAFTASGIQSQRHILAHELLYSTMLVTERATEYETLDLNALFKDA